MKQLIKITLIKEGSIIELKYSCITESNFKYLDELLNMGYSISVSTQ